ncbi:MAG TPA: ribbon-helix-helix protein, CopG family [Acidobacteriaceae bacterium]|nr:ribbon-helix-helix protein, CopG family [Acidobacteriaceae bacterium]
MPITLTLDTATAARLQALADARQQPPESILREALTRYLDSQSSAPEAPSEGKAYPRRHPVGGIITPV